MKDQNWCVWVGSNLDIFLAVVFLPIFTMTGPRLTSLNSPMASSWVIPWTEIPLILKISSPKRSCKSNIFLVLWKYAESQFVKMTFYRMRNSLNCLFYRIHVLSNNLLYWIYYSAKISFLSNEGIRPFALCQFAIVVLKYVSSLCELVCHTSCFAIHPCPAWLRILGNIPPQS